MNNNLILRIKKTALIIFSVFVVCSFQFCTKLVEVDSPYSSINSGNIYSTDATAASVLTGMYTKLSYENATSFNSSFTGLSLFTSLSSDDLSLFDINNQTYRDYYSNTLTSSTINVDFWKLTYPMIYKTNAAIEGLDRSKTLTPSVKNQLLGEAKFIRALSYFYLVNLYGGVPLATTSDYKINAALTRATESQVYDQIVNDLKEAQNLLNSSYTKSDAATIYPVGAEERVRPTKAVANSLLARVYLYKKDWSNAENTASLVLNNPIYDTVPLSSVFLKNNKEAVWQIQATGSGVRSNTGDARLFLLPTSGPSAFFPVFLNEVLVMNFEQGDGRKLRWVDSVKIGSNIYYYPAKYKALGTASTTTSQEYNTIFRLAELYLIRAEARAHQGKLTEARSDVNLIRKRAGLPSVTTTDQSTLLNLISIERRLEFFTEWGHRWFDLKRTGAIDTVMSTATPIKGGMWQTTDQLYPIPKSELNVAPQLQQNPGYN